jgi:DNA-binding response OmpR family regulator
MTARIVVADDEADIRRLIVFALRRRGYTVMEATAGDSALALIRAERPQLAILDVMMPGMSGLAVAETLGASPSTASIPILMLSARGQEAEIAEGLRAGAGAYLVKPFAPAALIAQVAALLGASGSAGSGGEMADGHTHAR